MWLLLASSVVAVVVATTLLVIVIRSDRPSRSDLTSPSDVPTSAPVVSVDPQTASTSTGTPTVAPSGSSLPSVDLGPDVSVSAVASRIDRYLAAGAGDDLASFEAQWSYPIESYYGELQATRDDVAQKAREYWATYPLREMHRLGDPTVEVSAEVVTARVQFHYELTDGSGMRRCGTNLLTFVFERTDGLPIWSIDEERGPSGC